MDTNLNLNIVKNEIAPCSLALKVEVLPPRVQKTFNEVVALYSKQAKVPGFRAGYVPAKIIYKRFAKEVVDEVKGRMTEKAYSDAIEAEKIRPVGNPDLKESDQVTIGMTGSFNFSFEVECFPSFDLPNYKGIKLTQKAFKANDEDIAKEMQSLVDRNTDYAETEEAAAVGDMVIVNYNAKLPEGSEISANTKYLMNGEKSTLFLKEGSGILPGSEKYLIGLKKGDETDGDITFPESHYNKEVAGKTFNYHFAVCEVKAAKVPALDDELAKKVGAQSLDDLKKRIVDSMKMRYDREQQNAHMQTISNQLLAAVDFQLPPKLLASQKNAIAAQMYQAELRKGTKKEDLEPKKDQMLVDAENQAVSQLRSQFLMDALATAENITVEQDELFRVIQQYAMYQGIKVEEMVKRLRESNEIPAIYENIRHQKTMEALLKLADITTED